MRTNLQTFGLDATCSYQLPVIDGGALRVIGGARYIDATIKTEKYNATDELANVSVKGHGLGWRVGAAFEYPAYAIRASVFYDSAVDLDMTGQLQTSLFGIPLDLDASADVTLPQGIEARIQTGIAPEWLVFAGVKWVDWSVLSSIAIPAALTDPSPNGASITAIRHFNFTDGWTVSAGLGHQLTDTVQIGSSMTWDQGIGTSYSDVYSLGLGGAWQINEHVKWSLGGALAYKTAAKNRYPGGSTIVDFGSGSTDLQDHMDLSYEASWNFALTTKLKFDL